MEGKYLVQGSCADMMGEGDSYMEHEVIQSLGFPCIMPNITGRGFIEVQLFFFSLVPITVNVSSCLTFWAVVYVGWSSMPPYLLLCPKTQFYALHNLLKKFKVRICFWFLLCGKGSVDMDWWTLIYVSFLILMNNLLICNSYNLEIIISSLQEIVGTPHYIPCVTFHVMNAHLDELVEWSKTFTPIATSP